MQWDGGRSRPQVRKHVPFLSQAFWSGRLLAVFWDTLMSPRLGQSRSLESRQPRPCTLQKKYRRFPCFYRPNVMDEDADARFPPRCNFFEPSNMWYPNSFCAAGKSSQPTVIAMCSRNNVLILPYWIWPIPGWRPRCSFWKSTEALRQPFSGLHQTMP
jgi:hypothetical protein